MWSSVWLVAARVYPPPRGFPVAGVPLVCCRERGQTGQRRRHVSVQTNSPTWSTIKSDLMSFYHFRFQVWEESFETKLTTVEHRESQDSVSQRAPAGSALLPAAVMWWTVSQSAQYFCPVSALVWPARCGQWRQVFVCVQTRWYQTLQPHYYGKTGSFAQPPSSAAVSLFCLCVEIQHISQRSTCWWGSSPPLQDFIGRLTKSRPPHFLSTLKWYLHS